MFSETLNGICNTLQNLRFVQPSVDEIGVQMTPLDIKCGSEIAWYKKGQPYSDWGAHCAPYRFFPAVPKRLLVD